MFELSGDSVISSVLSHHSKNLKLRMDQCQSSVYVWGVCNFPSSVSPQQKFEVMDGPVLQLSFIWQAKGKTSSRREGGLTQKIGRETHSSNLAPLLIFYFSSPEPDLCKLGWPGELFVSSQVLTLVLRPSVVLFSQAFPFFVFQPPPFWTLFSYANSLKFPPPEMGGPIL